MTQSLHTLLDHAEGQRDVALAAALKAEESARAMQEQSERLTAYRDEYRARHPASTGRSASIELLRCHQEFMQRLEQALGQQRQQQKAADDRAQALRRELTALEQRVASVRRLLERRGAEAGRQAQRQEQRRSDDAALRRRSDDPGAGWAVSALRMAP